MYSSYFSRACFKTYFLYLFSIFSQKLTIKTFDDKRNKQSQDKSPWIIKQWGQIVDVQMIPSVRNEKYIYTFSVAHGGPALSQHWINPLTVFTLLKLCIADAIHNFK